MVRHPAVYTDTFIPIFAQLLAGRGCVLDPFAGTGKLALIKRHGFTGRVVCNEIECEWAEASPYDVDEWHIGDAEHMAWAADGEFDAICTSPAYGNRVADHHEARDGSKRITYRHCLGRALSDGNTGAMQWGEAYRQKHIAVYRECRRVLAPEGLMIVNVSDHIRKGGRVYVAAWHRGTVEGLGLRLIEELEIETPRMRMGRNGDRRVGSESILIFEKAASLLRLDGAR